MNIPSKEDLDNLFGLMYEEYFKKRSSDTSINSTTQQVHNHEDSPSTSSIFIEEHEAPPIVTTSEEQTSPISFKEAEEFNQEDSTDFDGNTVFVPYDVPNFKATTDPSKLVMTQQRLYTNSEVCMYALTVSTLKPKNIKEAMSDHSWIESMQDELHQFERLDVWELVPRPNGKNIIAGYKQEEGIDFEKSFAPVAHLEAELGKDVTKNTSKSVSVKGRKGSTFQKVSCSKSTKTKAFKDLKFFDNSSSDDQGNVFRGVMNSDDTFEPGKDVTKTTSKSVSVKGRKDDQGNVFRGVVRGKPVESDVELKVVSVPDDVDAKRLPPVRNCILGLASSRTWQKIVQNDFGIKNYAELGKKLLQVKK
ncbi:hypothetical protein Tco_1504198, partial [Tanacetum coccineum]